MALRFVFSGSMPAGQFVAEFQESEDGRFVRPEVNCPAGSAPADVAAALRQLADKVAAL